MKAYIVCNQSCESMLLSIKILDVEIENEEEELIFLDLKSIPTYVFAQNYWILIAVF